MSDELAGVENALTRKVGPFPVWVYVGAGGGLILLLRRRASSSTSSVAATPPDASQAGLDSGAGGFSGGSPIDYGSLQVPSSNAGGFEDPPVTPIDTSTPVVSQPASDPVASPDTSVTTANPDVPVDLPLLAPFSESLIARGIDPATGGLLAGVVGDRAYGPGLYQGTPTVATADGQIPGGVYRAAILQDPQGFGEQPAPGSMPSADTVLVHENSAGVIAGATTVSSQLGDGSQVLHASTVAGAPVDVHPSVTGAAVANGTASLAALHAAAGRDPGA